MHSHRWVWLHHDDKVRETVEKLFKELEDQLILKDYILSNNKIIRSNAILIARILNSQSVIPTLLELLKADLKDTELLTEVIVALGDLNASESISYLAEMLPTDTESLKTAIIYSLGKLKARQYINTIINSLKDTSIAVRCEAIGALGEFGIEEYIQHLEPFISDVTHVQRTI
ncbi:MAG: HEAT repeat domain-containing protein, partial [Chloroflexota bacterium]